MMRHLQRPAEDLAALGTDLELEVTVTDDGLALLPSELELLNIARGRLDVTGPVAAGDAIRDTTARALERLGRLTARALERLAKSDPDAPPLRPHDAADHAWLGVVEVLNTGRPLEDAAALESCVNAFRWLDRHAQAEDERLGHDADELDRLRDALADALGRNARLERLVEALLDGARIAGGAEAFEGRYEGVGAAIRGLEEAIRKP